MKRTISIFLVCAAVVALFSGCFVGKRYTLTVTGQSFVLAEPLNKKYSAGSTVNVKVCKLADSVTYLYLDGEYLRGSGETEDGLSWLYSFVMPEHDVVLHLTDDRFYGREEIDFSKICYLSHPNDVDRVSITRYRMDSHTAFVEHLYSTKPEDIAAFKAMTEMKLVRLDTDSSLSSYRVREKYTFGFTLAHGYFSDTISLYDGHPTLRYDHGPTYVFDFKDETFTAPTIDDPDLVTYSFPMGISGTLGGYGDSDFSRERDYVSTDVEFVPYDGQPLDITPEYYFDCQLGRINLLSSTLFELNGNYYEIVRNADEWIFRIIEITLGINK